jgi:predicted kinase
MAGPCILVVTGASGVGKTTAVAALLARGLPQVNCFHFDSIGVPSPETIEREFGGAEGWQAQATDQWMLRLSQGPSLPFVDVLDAQTRPSFVRSALARLPHVSARIVLLDCTPAVRQARLVSRGQRELANPRMDAWAAYLRGQADGYRDLEPFGRGDRRRARSSHRWSSKRSLNARPDAAQQEVATDDAARDRLDVR